MSRNNNLYRARFDDAVLDMQTAGGRQSKSLWGPDGLQATMTRAVLNIETFALSTDADVLVFSDGRQFIGYQRYGFGRPNG